MFEANNLPSFLQAYMPEPEKPILNKWSFSAWSLMKELPYLLYAQEVLGIRRESNSAANRGTELHQGIEDYIHGKVDTCHEVGKEVVDRLKAQGYTLLPEETFYLAREWQRLPTDEGKAMTAIIDVLATHPDLPPKIIDWKSGRKYEIKHTQQGQLYAAVLHKVFGVDECEVAFHYLDGHKPLIINFDKRLMKQATQFWVAEGEKMLTYGKSAFAPPDTLTGFAPWYKDVLQRPEFYNPEHFPAPYYVGNGG